MYTRIKAEIGRLYSGLGIIITPLLGEPGTSDGWYYLRAFSLVDSLAGDKADMNYLLPNLSIGMKQLRYWYIMISRILIPSNSPRVKKRLICQFVGSH